MSPSRLLLVAALALSACASDPATDAGAGGEAAADPIAAQAPGGAACLHGTWAADAEQTFGPEAMARLMPPQEGGPRVRFREAAGRALITFEPDGTLRRRFEDFRVTMDSEMPGGQAMGVTMEMEGSDAARYTVDGDRLTFRPGTEPSGIRGRMRMTLDGRALMEPQEMDAGLFAVSEEDSGLLTYTCRGDELLLDIASPDEEGRLLFDDARYTRVR